MSSFGCSCWRAVAIASSSTPSTTAVNTLAIIGPAAAARSCTGPSQADARRRARLETHGVALRGGHAGAVPLGGQSHTCRAVPRPVTDVEHEDRRRLLARRHRRRDHERRHARAAAEVLVARHAIAGAEDRAVRVVGLGQRLRAQHVATGARLRRDRAPLRPVSGGGAHGLALLGPRAAAGVRLGQPERQHGRVHRSDERHRWVRRSQRPQHLADRPRRLGDAPPQPTALLRNGDEQEPGVDQASEVRRVEVAARLALAASRAPLAGDGLDLPRQP